MCTNLNQFEQVFKELATVKENANNKKITMLGKCLKTKSELPNFQICLTIYGKYILRSYQISKL